MAGRNSNRTGTSDKSRLDVDLFQSSAPKIRWKKGEKSDLARRVRNAQQKRRRAIKRGIPESALPSKIRGAELRDNIIKSRKDLNREIAELEKFMKADLNSFTDYGSLKITDYEMDQALRLLEIGNRAMAKEKARIEALEVKSMGKKQTYVENGVEKTYTVGFMGSLKDSEFKPVKMKEITDKTERWQWERFMNMLRKRADPEYVNKRNHLLQMNYLIALHNIMGSNGYTLMITEKIMTLTPSEFGALYYSDTDLTHIEYIYDENVDDRMARLNEILYVITGKHLDDVDPDSITKDNVSEKAKQFMDYYENREDQTLKF